MNIIFFIILFVGSMGLIYAGVKYKHWLLCAGSAVMFLVLALQAFRIEMVSGGVTIVIQEIVIVYVCWMMAIVGLVFTLVGAVNNLKMKGDKQVTK
jgi:hypothetical protein